MNASISAGETMFISFNPNTGLRISSYRQAQGIFGDVTDVESAMQSGTWACCGLDGAQEALEDGGAWQGSDATQENLEEIHALIMDYKKVQSND